MPTPENDAPDFDDPEVRGRVLNLGELAGELLAERDRLAHPAENDEGLIRHHRGNAALAATFDAMAEMPERIMQALAVHRWKTMGVSSVECECGQVVTGPEGLTEFPADEAFRRHIAVEATRVIPPEVTDA